MSDCPKTTPDRNERAIALLIILLVFVIGFVPYFLGEFRKPEGCVFIGYPYPLDTNGYFNEMLKGARQGILFNTNHSTTEDHDPAPVFQFYLILGKLASIAGLEYLAMFHLARVVFGAVLLWYLYSKSNYLFKTSYERIGFLAIVSFSCGFRTISEANTFQSITLFPHFSASYLFMAVYYFNVVWLLTKPRPWSATAIALAMILATAITHSWNLVPMGAVSVGFAFAAGARGSKVLRPDRLACGAALVLVAGASLLLHWRVIHTNAVFGAMARQNVMAARGWGEIVNAFGLMWIAALGGAALALRRFRSSAFVYPALWLSISAALMLAPLSFQRRLLEGLHMPVAILSTFCVFALARRVSNNRRGASIAGALVFLAATIPFNILFLRFPYLRHAPKAGHYPPEQYVATAQWIDKNLPIEANVLALPVTGQILIRYSLVDAFVTHSVGTLDFERKRGMARWFYAAQGPPNRLYRFLLKYNLEYVVRGPAERLSPEFRPLEYPWLRPIHREEQTVVYRVLRNDATPEGSL